VELYSLPFHIDQQETYEAPVPFNDDFARSGNVEVYAREYTNFHRAFTEGVLRISFADFGSSASNKARSASIDWAFCRFGEERPASNKRFCKRASYSNQASQATVVF
jgi:hypothetical protein